MNKKSFLYFLLYCILNIVFFVLILISKNNLVIIDWVSFLQLLLTMILSILLYKRLLSVFNIFVCLLYLFHFGQSLIRILYPVDTLIDRSVLSNVGTELTAKAEVLCIVCIFTITIGYVLFNNTFHIANIQKNIIDIHQDMSVFKKNILLLFTITLIPMLYIDIQKITALKVSSYDATYLVYQNGLSKYIGLIGQFCKLLFPLMIYCYKDDIKKSTKVFVFSSLYLLIAMLSGDRGSSVIYLITNVFVYFNFVKKIKVKTAIFGIFIVYFILGLISALSIFRYADFTLKNLVESYQFRKSYGIIYSTLREFGGSLLTLTHAIKYIPSYSPWGMGLTYFLSIFFVSPYIPNFITNNFINFISYTHAFPTYAFEYASLGGSVIGELYYNFGILTPVFTCILGIFIKKMDNTFFIYNEPKRVIFYIILLPSFFLWVRDFYVTIIFKTFWLSVLILYTGRKN